MKCLTLFTLSIPLLLLFNKNAFTQNKDLDNFNLEIQQIVQHTDFKNAQFALLAVDVNSHEVITEINADKSLKPASTLKLFSTAMALENCGADFKFTTTIAYTGIIDTIDKILHGDIVIVGGGDPTLGSKYFPGEEGQQFLQRWVSDIQKLGIDSIDGRIIADACIYNRDMVPPTWLWQDMGNYFGAGPCGLSVYDNMYTIYFKSGATVGDTVEIVRVIPEMDDIFFDNTVIASSIHYDNAYIYGSPYTNYRYLRGEIPLNKNSFAVKGSVPDPAYLTASEFRKALEVAGIVIKKEATTIRRLKLFNEETHMGELIPIASYASPPMSEIVKLTNIHSINLFAEHGLLQAGLSKGKPASTAECASTMTDFWENKGMDVQGLTLQDGSGLSPLNTLTARQMAHLLTYMKSHSNHYNHFYNSLPIAGQTGTIKSMFKGTPAEGKLRAKSGSMTGVSAYAGYTTSQSGKDIAFCLMVNNYSCSSATVRKRLERIMVLLTGL